MAESLDGYREVAGSKRHGVGYRSSRHFDVLNENILYLWRDDFFDYRTYADQTENNPNRTTGLIWEAFDNRKNAFEMSPVLLNLISHDEIFPTTTSGRSSTPTPSTPPWTACRCSSTARKRRPEQRRRIRRADRLRGRNFAQQQLRALRDETSASPSRTSSATTT